MRLNIDENLLPKILLIINYKSIYLINKILLSIHDNV